MIAGKLDLDIKKGCTFYKSFTWTDSAGSPIPITGWTPQCDARRSKNAGIAFNLGCTIISGSAGTFSFTISDETTKDLIEGKYKYDLIFDKGDGTRSEPVLEGEVTVKDVSSQKA